MQWKVLFFLVATYCLAGCNTMESKENACTVTPPNSDKTDRSVTAKVGADLTKFATFPVSVNADIETKSTVDATFQKIPDATVACAMLLQTYACIKDAKRAAQFQTYLSTNTSCH